MKKLLILSASFVSLMSTTNFFFLRLDRFIQLLNTCSVVIGLEFVFSNLCLTVCENLLSLSFQESPYLFILRIVSLSFLGAQHKSANNGSRRSIMTDGRRQTRRRAFFFRVIGSSSARVKERLADGDVIVVEVIREPLLARGLLGVFDISLCDEVVVGLITCGRNRSRPGRQGPQRKYAGYLSTTLRKLKMSGSRNSKVIREMMRKEMKSKRSEATLTAHMKHEDDYGMNGDSNLGHSVRASKQGKESRDDDTN